MERPSFKQLLKINIVTTLLINLITSLFFILTDIEWHKSIALTSRGICTLILVGLLISVIFIRHGYNAFSKKNKRTYVYAYLLAPLVSYFCSFIFSYLFPDIVHFWSSIKMFIISTLGGYLEATIFIILYKYVYLNKSKHLSELENLRLKSLVSETANQLLKQQIHPHFLFNSLNTVKSLYKINAEQGESYLVHLANFLRESISNPTSKIVKLSNELKLCHEYMEMQKLRFGSALTYTFFLQDDNVKDCKFIPYFALQTLLENALKHNEFTEKSPLEIIVKEENGYLTVSNNVQPKQYSEASTGIGLFNLSERYKLISNDEIIINDDGKQFSVSIKLLTDEDSNHRR
ncbi:histidine kinase [Fulvivirga maritima]|uniref:sensor histidine kinase n=1 Tax=Fulvivirga maritima TaxID=2904247 RepID=UPI001F45081E|nr:histidine kinase [Fulvivirga maritima]UII25595.1 histidine kinase [Fulvivirga maritima]